MLLVNGDTVKAWLKSINKNQQWLADMYGCNKSYVSQILNNGCAVSGNFVGFLMHITHMDFWQLFQYFNEPDCRKFYGKEVSMNGQIMPRETYYKLIESRIKHRKILDKYVDKVRETV